MLSKAYGISYNKGVVYQIIIYEELLRSPYSQVKPWINKKGFHYPGIKAWNDIPVNIRDNCSQCACLKHIGKGIWWALIINSNPLKGDSLEDQVYLIAVC